MAAPFGEQRQIALGIGGIVSSTVLALVVLPVLLRLLIRPRHSGSEIP